MERREKGLACQTSNTKNNWPRPPAPLTLPTLVHVYGLCTCKPCDIRHLVSPLFSCNVEKIRARLINLKLKHISTPPPLPDKTDCFTSCTCMRGDESRHFILSQGYPQ